MTMPPAVRKSRLFPRRWRMCQLVYRGVLTEPNVSLRP